MKSISESMKEFKTNEKKNEAVDVDKVIKALVDAKPSSDNAEQGKFVQLMRGLSFSDDPKATNFMKKLMGAIDNSFISDNVSEAKWEVTVPYHGKPKTVEISAKSEIEALVAGAKEVGVDYKNSLVARKSKAVKISEGVSSAEI